MPLGKRFGLNSRRAVASVLPFATASADLSQSYTVKLPIGKSLTIDWGDGSSDDYAGNDNTNVAVTHTYSGAGSYDIIFKGDYLDLTVLHCTSNFLTGDVSGWSALTSLTYLSCDYNSLTGDVSGWSAMTSLTDLSCGSNSLTGDVSGWSALTSLTYLYCTGNLLSGDVSSWSALTLLTYLSCYNNSLDFDNTTAWAALSLGATYFSNNAMTSTQVNNALIAFSGGPFLNTTIYLDGNNAARTAASDAAVSTLITAGCTVITNGLVES